MDRLYELVPPFNYDPMDPDIQKRIELDVFIEDQNDKAMNLVEEYAVLVQELEEETKKPDLSQDRADNLHVHLKDQIKHIKTQFDKEVYFNLRMTYLQYEAVTEYLYNRCEYDINNIFYAELFFNDYFNENVSKLRQESDFNQFRDGQLDVKFKIDHYNYTLIAELLKPWQVVGYNDALLKMAPFFRRLGSMNKIFNHYSSKLKMLDNRRMELIASTVELQESEMNTDIDVKQLTQ